MARKKRGPRSHHLDRYAFQIAADGPPDDALLTTAEMAHWFRCSEQWLAAGRSRGYGPPYERLGPLLIRYIPRNVKAWLAERSHLSTSDYAADNVKSKKAALASKAARASR